jgi:hypothetical protein
MATDDDSLEGGRLFALTGTAVKSTILKEQPGMARRIALAWIAAAACAAIIVTAPSIVSAANQRPAAKKTTAAASRPPAKATPPSGPTLPTVTFTGCLEAQGANYVLTDLQGSAAPKGRNWRTGFIKKSTKDVDIVSASSTLKLKDHVGHQVAVTGVQDDDVHMKARSLKHLASSCS